MTIKTKLAWSYFIIFAVAMTALAVSVLGMRQTTGLTEEFFHTNYARQTAYQEMFSQGLLSGIALRNLVMKPQLKKPYKVVPSAIAKFDAALEKAKQLSANEPDTLKALQEVEANWSKSRAAKLEVLEHMKAGQVEDASAVLTTREHPSWRAVRIQVQKLFDQSVANAAATRAEVVADTAKTTTTVVVLALLALVIGAVVALLNIRGIGRAFCSIIRSMNEIASGEGDLTRRLPADSNNEVGQMARAFNTFVEKIQALVGDVIGTIDQVRSAAADMSNISTSTRAGFERQLTEIEQVATAMHEMTATVQDVAQNASEASEAASEADRASAAGNEVVRAVIQAIDNLDKEINQTAGTIQNLHADSEQIGTVLDVIRGIAEQTNLLALNAAIEAARAGEQGRGFAVVADEVRTLASRTQESTQEIQAMIEKLQDGAKAAVGAMERGQQSARDSVGKAEEAGSSLDGITTSVSRIAQMNSQIAVAAEEQSAVAEGINRNVSSTQELAVKATDSAEQIASASQDLERLAGQLHATVGSFKV